MHATNHNDIRNNSNRTVDFLNLNTINLLHKEEIAEAVERVTTSGWFIRGEATRTFETQYARFIGTDHCVGCGNGLDAITLLFMAYKEMGLMADGDEVIVPANTYIASILAVTRCRLKPVLVEPDIQTLQIDPQTLSHPAHEPYSLCTSMANVPTRQKLATSAACTIYSLLRTMLKPMVAALAANEPAASAMVLTVSIPPRTLEPSAMLEQ